jgi:hypothetical protein
MRQGDRESGDSVMAIFWATCGYAPVGPKPAAPDAVGAGARGGGCTSALSRERVGNVSRCRIAAFLVGLSLLTTLASCKSSEPDPLPAPTKSATASLTPTTASWESKYNAEELDVYRAALAQWNAYKAEIQPYIALGEATPAAKKVYEPPRDVRRVDSLEGSFSWHVPRSTRPSCVIAQSVL